ncbi:hypothetical protein JW710_03490 [Candidatus Dojkabacteria bacterium]|nr:hypothetical protein [Candidatus Dojkabacteria bacterium]
MATMVQASFWPLMDAQPTRIDPAEQLEQQLEFSAQNFYDTCILNLLSANLFTREGRDPVYLYSRTWMHNQQINTDNKNTCRFLTYLQIAMDQEIGTGGILRHQAITGNRAIMARYVILYLWLGSESRYTDLDQPVPSGPSFWETNDAFDALETDGNEEGYNILAVFCRKQAQDIEATVDPHLSEHLDDDDKTRSQTWKTLADILEGKSIHQPPLP